MRTEEVKSDTTALQNTPTPSAVVPGPTSVVPTAGVTPSHTPRIAALYVGDLSPEVTESDLYELFKQVGAVQSIRVCRDSATRQSLGYAYVNFNSTENAERGLDTLNYTPLKGKPIRISWSQRDPSLRRSNVGNTFIKNLGKDIDALALEEIFGKFGNIASCKVQTDSEGNSLGFGFVHFENEEESKNAISQMDGKFLNGKKIFVGPFIPKKNREPVNHSSVFTNVYVKELNTDINEKEFEEIFTPYGTITSSTLKESNGKPYGFVNFEKHEEAVKAVEETNEKEIKGKKLYVARAQSKAEREEFLRNKRQKLLEKTKNCNLYMRNLSSNVTEKTLIDTFSRFGKITSVAVAKDKDGISKGFGFVCFSTPEEAAKVLKEQEIKLDGKPLFITYAQRKAERRAYMEAQHARRAPFPQLGYQRGFTAHPGYSVQQPPIAWTKEAVRFTNQNPFVRPGNNPIRPGNQQFVPPMTDSISIFEQLRGAVAQTQPEKAQQITTIILDSYKEMGSEASAQNLLKNPSALKAKIDEVCALLAKEQSN